MSANVPENAGSLLNITGFGPGTQVQVTDSGGTQLLLANSAGNVTSYNLSGGNIRRDYSVSMQRSIQSFACADINNDGKVELILGMGGHVGVYQATASGLKQVWLSNHMGSVVKELMPVNAGRNNCTILAAMAQGNPRIIRHKSSAFAHEEIPAGAGEVLAVAGDYDGDGTEEIVAMAGSKGNTPLYLTRMQGGAYQTIITGTIVEPVTGVIRLADVNGDNVQELITPVEGGTRVIIRFPISGLVITSPVFSSPIVDIVLADFERIGTPQLIVATQNEVLIFEIVGTNLRLVRRISIPDTIIAIRVSNINGRLVILVSTITGRVFIIRSSFTRQSQIIVRELITVPQGLPDILQVASVRVSRTVVQSVRRISSGVLVTGFFVVSVLYVAQPNRQVFSFDTAISFSEFVFAPVSGRVVDAQVTPVFVDFDFDPAQPRQLTVTVLARVVLFNFRVGIGDTLGSIVQMSGTPEQQLLDINELAPGQGITPGEQLFLP
ncbi:MAG: LysM peptidoglycan-binding domain-containing protein [Bacillota bacterium]